MRGWTLFCRWFTAVLFIVAAVSKIQDPAAFAKAVNNFQILPGAWVNVTAIYLPWLELVAAVALLFCRRLRDAAALLILLLLVVFTAAVGVNIYRGINVECGCFGERAGPVGWFKVGENTLYLLVAVAAYAQARRDVRGSG